MDEADNPTHGRAGITGAAEDHSHRRNHPYCRGTRVGNPRVDTPRITRTAGITPARVGLARLSLIHI